MAHKTTELVLIGIIVMIVIVTIALFSTKKVVWVSSDVASTEASQQALPNADVTTV